MKKTTAASFALALSLAGSSTALAADATAQYQAKVNGLCKAGRAKLDALPEPQSAAELKPFLQKGVAISKDMIAKIKAVTPPASLKANVTKGLAQQQKIVDMINDVIKAVDKGTSPEAAISAADAKITAATKAADTYWNAAGLKECAG